MDGTVGGGGVARVRLVTPTVCSLPTVVDIDHKQTGQGQGVREHMYQRDVERCSELRRDVPKKLFNGEQPYKVRLKMMNFLEQLQVL